MAFDIYEAVTGRIIQQIEAGTIPWERPWTGLQDGAFSRHLFLASLRIHGIVVWIGPVGLDRQGCLFGRRSACTEYAKETLWICLFLTE